MGSNNHNNQPKGPRRSCHLSVLWNGREGEDGFRHPTFLGARSSFQPTNLNNFSTWPWDLQPFVTISNKNYYHT